ncbi:MAG: acyl carrier protein [Legionella sp.]
MPAYPFIKQRYWYDLELNPRSAPKTIPLANNYVKMNASSQVLAYLRQVFAEKLQTTPDLIQVDETYEMYGVDSVIGL